MNIDEGSFLLSKALIWCLSVERFRERYFCHKNLAARDHLKRVLSHFKDR